MRLHHALAVLALVVVIGAILVEADCCTWGGERCCKCGVDCNNGWVSWLCPKNCWSLPSGTCGYHVEAGWWCPSGVIQDMYCTMDCGWKKCLWWFGYSCVECITDFDCPAGWVCAADRHICLECWRDTPNFDMCHNKHRGDSSKWFCDIYPDGRCRKHYDTGNCPADRIFVGGICGFGCETTTDYYDPLPRTNKWGACDVCGWHLFNKGCFDRSQAGPLCAGPNYDRCSNPCGPHEGFAVIGGGCGQCTLGSIYACDYPRGVGVPRNTYCILDFPEGGCYRTPPPPWVGKMLGVPSVCHTSLECATSPAGPNCDRTWWDKNGNQFLRPGENAYHTVGETFEGVDVSMVPHCVQRCPSWTGMLGSVMTGFTCQHCNIGTDCAQIQRDPCPTTPPGTFLSAPSCSRYCDIYSNWGESPRRAYCVDECPRRAGILTDFVGGTCRPCITSLDCWWYYPPPGSALAPSSMGSLGDTCFTVGSDRYPLSLGQPGYDLNTCDISCPKDNRAGYFMITDTCMYNYNQQEQIIGGWCTMSSDCWWKGSAGIFCFPAVGGCTNEIPDWAGMDPFLGDYIECRTGADCATRAMKDADWVGYKSWTNCDATVSPRKCVPESTCVGKQLGIYGLNPGKIVAVILGFVEEIVCFPLYLICNIGPNNILFSWACGLYDDCRDSLHDALDGAIQFLSDMETLFATCDYCITGIECNYLAPAAAPAAWCSWGTNPHLCLADCGTTLGRFSVPLLGVPNVCYRCVTGLDCLYDVNGHSALSMFHACDYTAPGGAICKHSLTRGVNCPKWAGRIGLDLDRAVQDLTNALQPVIDVIASIIGVLYPDADQKITDAINDMFDWINDQVNVAVSTCYYGCITGTLECVSDRTEWGWCDTITDLHNPDSLATTMGFHICVDAPYETDPRLGRLSFSRTLIRCVSGADCAFEDYGQTYFYHTCDHTNDGQFGHIENVCRHTNQNELSCPALAGRSGMPMWAPGISLTAFRFMGDCRNCWTGFDCIWHEPGKQRLCRLNSVMDPTLYPHNIPNPLEGDPYAAGACVLEAEPKDGMVFVISTAYTMGRCRTALDCWWCDAAGPLCEWEDPWHGCRPCESSTGEEYPALPGITNLAQEFNATYTKFLAGEMSLSEFALGTCSATSNGEANNSTVTLPTPSETD